MSSSTPGWILDARLHIAAAIAALAWCIAAGALPAPHDEFEDNEFSSAYIVRYETYGPDAGAPADAIARH